MIQMYEYCFSDYSINDGIFGSLFFLLTGFHGLHVIIGTIFLFVCLHRQIDYHFTSQHHLGCASKNYVLNLLFRSIEYMYKF